MTAWLATHSSNTIVKFADDTTVIGLITGNDDETDLQRANSKRRQREEHGPLCINRDYGGESQQLQVPPVHISEDLTWTHHTDFITKSARQWLFFLRRLRRLNMDSWLLCSFYRCTIERILTGSASPPGHSGTGTAAAPPSTVRLYTEGGESCSAHHQDGAAIHGGPLHPALV
ncbi:hypothetical protein L3Q82_015531 [Scortum barcoo]|uniref:Uncharacterized protein n=1 Tax=Scortum barcoo TaxID=214431 RepID=A0ACB8VS95_9TELE|nr:hypothetical protein L3Q82_015531 [Scortum barcoo]